MIISKKQNLVHKVAPAYEFDNFLRIRSQKQSIIQSDCQPIQQKVQGFQDLLKLTKTGSSICTFLNPKRHPNNQLKNKSQSSKTLITHLSHIDHQYNNKFDDNETDETQLKRLNKMVHGITQWEQNKQKQSFHVERKVNYPKTSHTSKRVNNQLIEKSSKQKFQERKLNAYTSADGKKFRKFYAPKRKYQAKSDLDRINSEFIKSTSHVNYPQTFLKKNMFTQNENQFKDLKKKIKDLENKAKRQYGIQFQNKECFKKINIFDDSKQNSQQKENQQYDFSDLQFGPILAKQFPNRYKNYHKMLEQQNLDSKDCSVPRNLLNIIHHRSESYHNFSLANTKFGYRDVVNRSKMKKKYHQRPRTFKPTYTYVRI